MRTVLKAGRDGNLNVVQAAAVREQHASSSPPGIRRSAADGHRVSLRSRRGALHLPSGALTPWNSDRLLQTENHVGRARG